jgi:hypothetical protein
MRELTIEIPDKETKLVIEFLKKIGGKVKAGVDENSPYDSAFVAKVQKGVEARESGKAGQKVDVDNLWK